MKDLATIVEKGLELVQIAQYYYTIKVLVIKNNPRFVSIAHKGWGNGYVMLPSNHPSYGLPYDDIDVNIHGGLTFSEYTKNLSGWEEVHGLNGYIIGFDTLHYADTIERWPEKAVRAEAEYLKKQLIQFPNESDTNSNTT